MESYDNGVCFCLHNCEEEKNLKKLDTLKMSWENENRRLVRKIGTPAWKVHLSFSSQFIQKIMFNIFFPAKNEKKIFFTFLFFYLCKPKNMF